MYVTPSGMLSHRYLAWTLEILGAERIMFSTDYPFEAASRIGAREFLDAADIAEDARERIANGNWERIRDGIRR